MSQPRLDVRKTYKLFIGGAFVRSESGRTLAARAPDGTLLDNYGRASRKDFRDAVAAARGAFEGWAKRTAYLRGQIIYRAAEMLQCRNTEMAREIERSTGAQPAKARAEVAAAIDRLICFAGWTDKYQPIFGSVNPVATPHFNFTTPEPSGVVSVLAPDEPSFVPLVAATAAVILSGNAAVVLASERYPLPALTFAEVLATSDLPAGVVNILAGPRGELAPHIASHMDVNAIVDATGLPEVETILRGGAAQNMKRYASRRCAPEDWFSEKAEDPYWILDTVEFKTAWHPIGA